MAEPAKPRKRYKSYSDVWELRDGAILIYKRKDNAKPCFQYRLRIRGVAGYIIESSKTRDLLEAARIAEDRYDDLRADVKRFGAEYIAKRTWADIWKEFEQEVLVRKVRRKEIKPKRQTKMTGIWNNWIKPFWAKKRCTDVTEPTVAAYWDWRMGMNDAPNNTLLDQSKTFTALVRFAINKGYMDRNIPKLTPDVKKEKNRRGAFTLHQVQEIDKHLAKWIRANKRKDTRQARECFRTFVMLGFYSGMRLGEMLNLKWGMIQLPDAFRRSDGSVLITWGDQEVRLAAGVKSESEAYEQTKSIVQIHLPDADSKTGFRPVVPMKEAADLLEWWRLASHFCGVNDYVFPNRKGKRRTIESFEKMHRETIKTMGEDYIRDRYGFGLYPYSYRHTYATVMLIHSPEVRMEDLCVNMGTSMEQMKNHYSHVTSHDLMEKLSAQVFHLAQGVA